MPPASASLETLLLRLDVGGSASYPPGTVIGPRRIKGFELVWVDAGSATYAGPGGEVRLARGQVLLVRPGERHAFRMDRQRMLRHGFVHFTVSPPAAARELMGWPNLVRLMPGSLLAAVLQGLEGRLQTGSADLMENRLALRLALALFHGSGVDPVPTSHALDPLVAAVLDTVRRRWVDEPGWSPGMSDLVAASGLSTSALGRAFRAAFGYGPVAAVRRWQLERAARLVATSPTLAEAARSCGYADPDRFARAFRAAYGMSPRLARTRIRAGTWLPLPLLVRLATARGRHYPSFPARDPSLPV